MRKLACFFVTVGLVCMTVAHFADALGLGGTPGVGADQLLGVLLGAGLLGLGLILLLTPGEFDLSLPPEPRIPAQSVPRRRPRLRLRHARHY